jgi:hypothetical protein
MKRVLTAAAVAALLATPAAAQYMGLPVWNSPKGGTGVTLNADLGLPNEDAGKGTAFGARASVGLANLTLTGGFASWKPDGAPESFTSFGGSAAFRVIGGSLLPVAVNLLAGAARTGEVGTGVGSFPATTSIVAGGGVSASLPTPGVSIEPYISLTNRWLAASGFDTESNFGVTVGANLGFGMFGIHLAYDTVSDNGSSNGVFGMGAHVSLRAPIGM